LPRSEAFEPVEDRLVDDVIDEEFAPVTDDYDRELDVDAEMDVELDDAPVTRKLDESTAERPRRRRRRRRGRGRSSESAVEPLPAAKAPVRSPSYSDEDDDVEDDGDYLPAPPPPPRREPARSAAPRGRRPEVAPERVDDLLDDEEDDDAVDHGEHRSIPTWQDAIGLVVGANMEARAKNPGGNRNSRGRGGRGRGGRGR
jgi:ribonuclease E